MADLPSIEVDEVDEVDDFDPDASDWSLAPAARTGPVPFLIFAALGVLAGWWIFGGAGSDADTVVSPTPEPLDEDEAAPDSDLRLEAARVARQLPGPLLAAELYMAQPTGSNLRGLLESIGGLRGAAVATATGAFDLVTFDPVDADRLLAVHRSGYGPAANQLENEIWSVSGDGIDQQLWAADTEHDFAMYNADGTITMWVHPGGAGFAPRVAVINGAGREETRTSPLYASHAATADGRVFALTGNGDYYSNDEEYVALVAADGGATRVLADGAPFAWIDSPVPGVVVAYPRDRDGLTAVWDVATLESRPDHGLAGLPYRRLAVSGDGSTTIGVSFDDQLELIDPARRSIVDRFGNLDPTGIDRPVVLNHDGSLAITVAHDGVVGLWLTATGAHLAAVAGDAGPLRWVPERLGARSATAVSAGGERIALKVGASPGVESSWVVIDISPDAWVRRACELGGRAMGESERRALGLDSSPVACLSGR